MVNVIHSEYPDFNFYVEASRKPSWGYVENFDYSGDERWKFGPIVKIIDREDYKDEDDYLAATEKMDDNVTGICCEVLGQDFCIFIDIDNKECLKENEVPKFNIVNYC